VSGTVPGGWERIPGAGAQAERLITSGGTLIRQTTFGTTQWIFLPDRPGGADSDTLLAAIQALQLSLQALQQALQTMSETSLQHADALAAQLTTMDATLKAGVAAIAAEIADLKAANPAVNFASLDTAVANLGTDVAAAAAIPPAPTPTPAPAAP